MAEISAWRVTDPRWAASAFDGEGALRYGGRFNSIGERAVYASGSLALAVLEMLVQAGRRSRIRDHVCFSIVFDTSQVEIVEASDLPPGWDHIPHQRASQEIGDAWLRERRSLLLRIPSVVVPVEYNYVINPLHPDMASLRIGAAQPVPVDRRIDTTVGS